MRLIDQTLIAGTAAGCLWLGGCAASGSTVQPASADPPEPYGAVPSNRQLAWHELEFYGFVHFTTNTFTDREWGYGDEPPAVFNPTDFDAEQIVATAASAGMRGLILTCKHHDGFCLWDSKYTEHDVASSPWRGGQGDVVREIMQACRRHGVKFGVYLSPWDRNHPDYGTPAYITYFRNQLRELLTNYGDIFEVWFDGANGGDGYYGGARETRHIDRGTYYQWDDTIELVRALQPMATIFSDAGPDVRWVGNESGAAGDPCWATYTPRARDGESKAGPGTTRSEEGFHGQRDGEQWLPAEADVSIRPGWFYHASQDNAVRSAENLVDLYFGSVGHGASFLLNLPPDRRGQLHENDVESLQQFRVIMDATFTRNLAANASITASNTRGGDDRWAPRNVLDSNRNTYWAPDDDPGDTSLIIDLGAATLFNIVSMREYLPLGHRVDDWAIDTWHDGRWQPYATGIGIGPHRLVRGQYVTTRRIRLRFSNSAACPAISDVSLHTEPPRVTINTSPAFLESQPVDLTCDMPGASIHYTLDGSIPNEDSPIFAGPLIIDRSCTIQARAAGTLGHLSPRIASMQVTAYSHQSLHPAVQFVQAPDPGLRWTCYEAGWQTLDQLPGLASTSAGEIDSIDIAVRSRNEHVAVVFEGFLKVPTDGIYTFATTSDDGSRLSVHERMVVDNDGLHGMVQRSGLIGLRAGWHPIRIEWFNATGGLGLDVQWAGPGFGRQPIPASALFR